MYSNISLVEYLRSLSIWITLNSLIDYIFWYWKNSVHERFILKYFHVRIIECLNNDLFIVGTDDRYLCLDIWLTAYLSSLKYEYFFTMRCLIDYILENWKFLSAWTFQFWNFTVWNIECRNTDIFIVGNVERFSIWTFD